MDQIKAVVIEAGNPEIKIVDKFNSDLESLQKAVGGYIEAIRLDSETIIWVNEDGKVNDLKPNFMLTRGNKGLDYLVGNIVITGCNSEGDNISLTDSQLTKLKNAFVNRTMFDLQRFQ